MSEHPARHDIASRLAELHANDPEFTRAAPSPDVARTVRRSAGSLVGTMAATMHGYADRPALAHRAHHVVRDPATGEHVLELLPSFETLTYAELWQRVGTLSTTWADPACGLRPGDFVAMLGFTGVDHATIDLACLYLGAVSVPLPLGWSAPRLAPVIAETGPRILAADIGSIDTAVDTVLASASIDRLVVFDCDPRVDGHRNALRDAVDKLNGRATVVTLRDELRRGGRLPAVEPYDDDDPDRLAGLIYTSGSTGTPKGALYTASMITGMWQTGLAGMANAGAGSDTPVPTIVLHYMPMSHVNGRAWLVSGLSSGGIGFFAARSDMSTLFDDIRLSRPTVLSLVPRICDMVFQRYSLEAERLLRTGMSRPDAEAAALHRVRDAMLGGRVVSALCGSAPLSPATRTFMASVLGTGIVDCYGSTETTRAVVVNQRVRRPPVIDYRLVDVPELGYFTTDKPHPRGELRLKSAGLVPGYYKQPEITARAFDDDGYYRTGDVFAETAPDHLVYVDRVNNVVKLSQGEFVALSRLEALYSAAPHIAQIYVHGSSEQAFLLAVVVPDRDRPLRDGPGQNSFGQADDTAIRAAVLDSMRELAHEAGLRPYEVPHDILIAHEPFTVENGLLSGVGKLLRPAVKERYGAQLEELYADIEAGRTGLISALRATGRNVTPLEAVLTAVQITLGCPASVIRAESCFMDLGGDSLSAHTFSTVLEQIIDVEVPIQAVLDPTSTLARIASRIASGNTSGNTNSPASGPANSNTDRAPDPDGPAHVTRAPRPTFASVHGRDAVEVRAADLTLDRFVDERLLDRSPRTPDGAVPVRNVLITGSTGYLGRFLAVEWLRRLAGTGGRLICLARAADDAAARQRVIESLRAASPDRADRFDAAVAGRLEVVAADVSAPRLGLDTATWERLAAETDHIVHAAALVNHVLPYSRLFAPNVAATAELMELALSDRMKRFTYVSTIAVALRPDGSFLDESADVRAAPGSRRLDGSDANGYAASKWAGEVLLREAHDRTGLPVTVFRPGMILAHSRLPGCLNLPDRFTRLLLSILATGMAPRSFYRLDHDGNRCRAHYSGLPVDFTAEAIASLSARGAHGYVTYNTVNANDDGVSLDEIVGWLIRAGHPITRFDDYAEWHMRFESALRGLPDHQRRLSLLPLTRAYAQPAEPRTGPEVPASRFTTALAGLHADAVLGTGLDPGTEDDLRAGSGPGTGGSLVPSLTEEFITKCVADLRLLGLVH